MSASPKPRSVFSAVCRSNGIVLGRTRATVGSRFSLNASLASAYSQSAPVTSFVRVIRAVTSLWHGKLVARKLERGGPVFGARSLATLFSSHKGPLRLIQNFCRRFGSGKPSFLRIPFVDHCSEATNSITHAFRFSPIVVGQVHRSQSAPSWSFVRVSDTHRDTKRKRSWVTNIGSETT